MKKCKMPNCGKQLVGKEKYLCQSCKDKIKDNGTKTAKVAAGLIVSVITINKKLKK